MSRISLRQSILALAAVTLLAPTKAGAESVNVSLPASVSFFVANVSASTTGSPDPTAISFDSADLVLGNRLRISVQADAADFTPPAGTAIPASKVSWTTSGAVGGTGSNGTLSSSSYSQVYQSNPSPSFGSVNVVWDLAAPGSGIRAGDHTLTVRWKLESVAP